MIYLILSIVFMAGMPVVLRMATQQQASPWMLNSVFRVIGGLVALGSLFFYSDPGDIVLSRGLVVASICGGLFYWLTAYASTHALRHGHLGISWTVTRCSMVIPTLASLFLFQEAALLSTWQSWFLGVGIILVVVAVVLFGVDRARHRGEAGALTMTRSWILWLSFAFITMAGWEVTLAYAGSLPDDQSRFLFLQVAFLVAGLLSLILIGASRRLPTAKEWQFGGAAAICALIGSGMRPWAVHELGGRLVFPVTAVAVIALVQGVGRWAWKEKVGPWGFFGFLVALVAVGLLGFL